MKKIVQILVFAALACACTPQAFTMLVEQKKLSSVGIDLSGKSVSVSIPAPTPFRTGDMALTTPAPPRLH